MRSREDYDDGYTDGYEQGYEDGKESVIIDKWDMVGRAIALTINGRHRPCDHTTCLCGRIFGNRYDLTRHIQTMITEEIASD